VNSVYFQSVLMTPPRIMGVQLRPFSAYHALVLLQFDSPFMLAGGKPDVGDLIFALNVLSYGYEDGLEDIKAYRLKWFIRMLFTKQATIDKAIADIDAHIDGYAEYPEIWASKDDKSSAVPWPFRVTATILRRYRGFSEAQAWDMGLCKASCYRACYVEDCGGDLHDEQGIEGQHKRWIKSPDYAKYNTLAEFLEAEKANG
jgi:hypothetical protein